MQLKKKKFETKRKRAPKGNMESVTLNRNCILVEYVHKADDLTRLNTNKEVKLEKVKEEAEAGIRKLN